MFSVLPPSRNSVARELWVEIIYIYIDHYLHIKTRILTGYIVATRNDRFLMWYSELQAQINILVATRVFFTTSLWINETLNRSIAVDRKTHAEKRQLRAALIILEV